MYNFIFLFLAICLEIVATTILKSTNNFTRIIPTIITLMCYAASFYCLSLTLRTIPVGIAYAIWSGVGIVLVTILAFFIYKQKLDWAAVVGIGLIVAGVVIMQLFSKSTAH